MHLGVVVDELRAQLPELRAVYLFGSVAAGTPTAESDVDIAVLLDRPLDPDLRFAMQEELALRLGRNVDLVDLQRASTVLRVRVLDQGRALWDDATTARAMFEAHTLSDYARLNEERRAILADVQSRGTVYKW